MCPDLWYYGMGQRSKPKLDGNVHEIRSIVGPCWKVRLTFSSDNFCLLGSGSVQHDWKSRLFVVFPGEKPLVAEAVFQRTVLLGKSGAFEACRDCMGIALYNIFV